MKANNKIAIITVFLVLPLGIYAYGDFPVRSLLKESFSVLTLIAYFIMLLQFFLSRLGRTISTEHKMSSMIKWHKALGYVFVSVLLFHPLLIVIPRFFESGITPVNAFLLMLETFNDTPSVLLGIIAWCLLLLIGLTSFFRSHLGMTYKTWRVVHGIMSILFVALADIHILLLGRHMNSAMVFLTLFLSLVGIALLLRIYFVQPTKNLA